MLLIHACLPGTLIRARAQGNSNGDLVQFPSAEVEFIVGPQVRSGSDPLAGRYDEVAARRAKFWAEKFLAEPLLVVSNHYDLPLCLYTEFYRTADPEYQRLARLVADKWWRGPNVNRGLPVAGGDIPPPMYVGLMGLTLYALDGHPEVFGYLDRVTREWMDIRLLGKINAPDIYTDMRDEGYILLAAVTLARTLPDSFPQVIWDNNLNVSTVQRADGAARRARYLADAENVAVNYFGRLQEADGSWLWRAWNPEPALQQKIDARRAAGLSDKFEQPFMVGIYMEAAAALHGLTQSASVKEHLRGQIARHCEHLMRDTYVVAQTPSLTSIPRVLLYFYPRDFVFDPTASDRHLTTSVIHTFGYAYQVTGEAKYLAWGDELWDSCFANVPRDGYRSGLDEFYHLKLFTGEFRSSGRYLARRRGGATPPPPSPSPSPTTPDYATIELMASSVSETQINLDWDNNSSSSATFQLERCQGAGCTKFALIAVLSRNLTSYGDASLAANTTYRYRVQATDRAGSSPYSNIAQATTKPLRRDARRRGLPVKVTAARAFSEVTRLAGVSVRPFHLPAETSRVFAQRSISPGSW